MPENIDQFYDPDDVNATWELIVFYLPDSLSTLILEKSDEHCRRTGNVIERLIEALETFHGEQICTLQDPPKERILRPVSFLVDYRCIEMLVAKLNGTGVAQSQAIRRLLYALLVTKELEIVVQDWEIKMQKAQFNKPIDIQHQQI